MLIGLSFCYHFYLYYLIYYILTVHLILYLFTNSFGFELEEKLNLDVKSKNFNDTINIEWILNMWILNIKTVRFPIGNGVCLGIQMV